MRGEEVPRQADEARNQQRAERNDGHGRQQRRDLPSKLIAFSVHRWQAHLLDEGATARVGMEKVESGVRLSQEQQ